MESTIKMDRDVAADFLARHEGCDCLGSVTNEEGQRVMAYDGRDGNVYFVVSSTADG